VFFERKPPHRLRCTTLLAATIGAPSPQRQRIEIADLVIGDAGEDVG
jgi:hypothetical protein